MTDDEDSWRPEPDTDEYALVNSVDTLFEAEEWDVPAVRLVEDSLGQPLAFVAISRAFGDEKRRNGLPTEFFSHQLSDLDYGDAHELAAFMDEYGFLGSKFGTLRTANRMLEDLAALDPMDIDEIGDFETKYGYMATNAPSALMPNRDHTSVHYIELQKAVNDLALRLAETQPDATLVTERRVCGMVSVDRATWLYENWLFIAEHIKALVRFNTPCELAAHLGEDEYVVMANCRNSVEMLQKHLDGMHPRLDLIDLTDGQRLTSSGGGKGGSFEKALALQLWNFVLEAKNGYTLCKECGQVFVHRQSKTRKGSARSTGLFCCDRCKNRHAQREHRKTEGYRIKQERKRIDG